MENVLLINGKYFCLYATAALLISSAPMHESTLLPSRNHLTAKGQTLKKKYSWEQLPSNPYYDYTGMYSEDIQNYIVVQNFASSLLENIQDLDPAIAKKVNETFWNLI